MLATIKCRHQENRTKEFYVLGHTVHDKTIASDIYFPDIFSLTISVYKEHQIAAIMEILCYIFSSQGYFLRDYRKLASKNGA